MENKELNIQNAEAYAMQFPKAVSGRKGHNTTYALAAILQDKFQLSRKETFCVLKKWNETLDEPWSDSELKHKIQSTKSLKNESLNGIPNRKWPKFDHHLFKEITLDTNHKFSSVSLMPNDALDKLFPGNELLCIGPEVRSMVTDYKASWLKQDLTNQTFIVPNPMTAFKGRNQRGYLSSRSLNNTGKRRYLVIEMDHTYRRDQIKVHWHLQKFFPLMMLVDSAGKSIHGWYDCTPFNPAQQLNFMRYAVSLGADSATWNKCQPVRLPGGMRHSAKRIQTIIYIKD